MDGINERVIWYFKLIMITTKFVYNYLTQNLKITLVNNFGMGIFFSEQIQNLYKPLYLPSKFRKVRIFLTEIMISGPNNLTLICSILIELCSLS